LGGIIAHNLCAAQAKGQERKKANGCHFIAVMCFGKRENNPKHATGQTQPHNIGIDHQSAPIIMVRDYADQ